MHEISVTARMPNFLGETGGRVEDVRYGGELQEGASPDAPHLRSLPAPDTAVPSVWGP